MPGLIRGVARTAAVVGTATVVSNGVSRRQQGRWAEKDAQQQAEQPPQQSAPPPAAAPASGTDDKLGQLKELGALRDSGVLTQEEFDAQKAKILAG